MHCEQRHYLRNSREGDMRAEPTKKPQHRTAAIGATEDQVDMKDTVPQRINKQGTKIEDLAGTGEQDSKGG